MARPDRTRPSGVERWFADEPAPVVPQSESLELRRLFEVLWRRKFVILGTIFIATALAVLYVMRQVPLYTAETQVVIDVPRSNVLNIETVATGASDDWFMNQTEAAILASRALAEKVVAAEGLERSPLFNPELALPRADMLGRLDVRAIVPRPWLVALGIDLDDATGPLLEVPPEEQARLTREAVVDAYLAGLEVVPADEARVITVRYVSEDPATAARLANAAAQTYIADQIASKANETRAAYAWLQDRAVELQEKVEAAARAVEEQRAAAGLVDVEGSTLLAQQLANFNTQLITARGERAEAEARFEQVQRLLAGGGIDSAAAVLDSPLIQRLREQEAEVLRNIAELRTQYRDNHPKLILAESELDDLRAKIEAEVSKIATNLGNELEIADVKVANLEQEVARLETQTESQLQATVTLRALEAELDANQRLFDTVLDRLKETSVQDETLVTADARIISFATVPSAPSYPRKRLIVAVAFVAATFAGVLLALLIEQLDSGFRDSAHVEAITGAAVIGMTPRLSGRRGRYPHDEVVERPGSIYAEAIRTLRTSLLLSNVDHPPRIILFTSSMPGEGKTSTALALARTAAKAGQRAIVIDADLRNPSLHAALRVTNDAGLIDVLGHAARLDEVVRIDFPSGAHFVTAGRPTPHPTDLLSSGQMKGLLRGLAEAYDYVVIDTPPVTAVSDALVLQRSADKTVLIVRWEACRRDLAVTALRLLVQAGADLAGIVLSQVAPRGERLYSYYGDAARHREGTRRAPSG
jgi:capsular exopolysaccharide synthesis family protein